MKKIVDITRKIFGLEELPSIKVELKTEAYGYLVDHYYFQNSKLHRTYIFSLETGEFITQKYSTPTSREDFDKYIEKRLQCGYEEISREVR